ncbi:MAG: ABC transporter permease [Terriglobales bacterium]
MILPPVLDKLLIISRRDLLTGLRYRTGFWLQSFSMIAELAASFYLAQAIGPGFRPDGVDYYTFLLVGTALFGFLIAGVAASVKAVHDAQVTGTMEVLMTTSTSAPVLVLLTTFSTFAGRTLYMIFYLAAGFALFQVPLDHPNLPACAVIFALLLVIASSLGVMAAAVQVVTQKGGGVVFLLASLGGFLGGTMFPISVLPSSLRNLAELFPLTHAVQGTRLALLQGASFAELSPAIGVLSVYALLLLPASLYLFSSALRYSRRNGTLSFY